MSEKIYIAYGSNMDLRQMHYRCPGSKLIGKGIIKGWKLCFQGSCSGYYANIKRAADAYTPVLIWSVTGEDERFLDHYEGYPNFYNKRNIEFEFEDGVKGSGMVYIIENGTSYGLPADWYLEILREAYRKFGFENKVLLEALGWTIEKIKEQ